ncbi:MAG: dehydrogenase [Cyclobacteriaceae bacterium]|nr:MAG: dehydrogenase [Cyclobacteriaceae bacterium]
MRFDAAKIEPGKLLSIYENLLLPRLIEERMILLLRQGKISKWFSGIGQEATSVGAAMAVKADEYILPMHRNLGVFTVRQLPLERLFAQFQGKTLGFTKGRDRSFHFGSAEHFIVGMISHLGAQLAVADGIALGHLLDNEKKVTLVFTGDAGTSEGDFHEALNVASVWKLPVIFLVENNGYGLSTPSSQQFNFKSFTDKGIGYGVEAISIDGNNVLEVFNAINTAAKKIRRSPRPILIEANTFRMRGHEEASGTKYVPDELMADWAKKDPITNYEQFLITTRVITKDQKSQLYSDLNKKIEAALGTAFSAHLPHPDPALEISDIYAKAEERSAVTATEEIDLRFVDAIKSALGKAMDKHLNLVLMGQDIAEYGGVFKVTEGFLEKFGESRVRNTPLCESAILGIALGLSIKGFKSMVEMQFADFVTCGFNQIINNLAKSHYRWSQNADVVIRMPTGAGVSAGPFHSQSNEAWFFHTPGLKIVYPSNPAEAHGLLLSAIEDPNPVLFFEHKALYRSISGPVPTGYVMTPIGKALVKRQGNSISVVTYGMGVHWAEQLFAEQPDLDFELIDLRSLQPWDHETVAASVKKCGKVLVLHEDCLTGGIGAEIVAWIAENCFEYLDAPVRRVGSLDTPVPFSSTLEENFLPKQRFRKAMVELLEY